MNTHGIKDIVNVTLAKHGLTVESKFVPFSQSRNKHEKQPSLNWIVTLKHNGRDILTTDYMAGMGHCPSYKQGRQSWDDMQVIKWECEKGYPGKLFYAMGHVGKAVNKAITPDPADVIYSLLIDSEVLDYDFEEWAGNFGYDTDSRKAEQTYQACMKIALQFRRIGESVIAELRKAYQNY